MSTVLVPPNQEDLDRAWSARFELSGRSDCEHLFCIEGVTGGSKPLGQAKYTEPRELHANPL
jgi:hypothetical protein